MIVVGISGFADADLLAGCVASVPRDWPIVYCDGRVRDYPLPNPFRMTDARAVFGEAIAAGSVAVIEREVWEDEAEKKTAICREAFARYGPGWLLLLDTDERVEIQDPANLAEALRLSFFERPYDWLEVNIYRPEHAHAPQGFLLPRIVRLHAATHYRGPHDLHAYIGDKRIAYLDGEPVPDAQLRECAALPLDFLRIRHDRHLRSADRLRMNGEYQQARRERTGH